MIEENVQADRTHVITQLKSLGVDNKQFRMIMDEKRKEMEPLQQALGKLRGVNSDNRERGSAICSSEEELNNLVSFVPFLFALKVFLSYVANIQSISNFLLIRSKVWNTASNMKVFL